MALLDDRVLVVGLLAEAVPMRKRPRLRRPPRRAESQGRRFEVGGRCEVSGRGHIRSEAGTRERTCLGVAVARSRTLRARIFLFSSTELRAAACVLKSQAPRERARAHVGRVDYPLREF